MVTVSAKETFQEKKQTIFDHLKQSYIQKNVLCTKIGQKPLSCNLWFWMFIFFLPGSQRELKALTGKSWCSKPCCKVLFIGVRASRDIQLKK